MTLIFFFQSGNVSLLYPFLSVTQKCHFRAAAEQSKEKVRCGFNPPDLIPSSPSLFMGQITRHV
jgi:hypothetical protein